MFAARITATVTFGLAACATVVGLGAGGCGGADDDSTGATYNCEAETRDEQFLAGMEKVGPGGVSVKLDEALPAPPGRDDNTWEIDVGQAGSPLTGATIKVTPYMPDHRHGTSVPVIVTPDPATPGRYELSPINLWMPGLWQITIDVTPAGGTRDSVVFNFCIAG